MNTTKILIATLVGGIVNFFAGWLLYGMLFASFMEVNSDGSLNRPEMQLGPLFLGSLATGLLLALIFGRWANISKLTTGLVAGGIITLLTSLSFDLNIYGTSTMLNLTAVVVDPIIYAVMGALTGGAVAWTLGYKK